MPPRVSSPGTTQLLLGEFPQMAMVRPPWLAIEAD